MNDFPLVTVLMPVYNGEKHLNQAIYSILNQTYSNFEFLIINDGSTDLSEEIILSFDDNRIRYVKNEKNIKLIQTLNKGIRLSKGKYIARMDCDDISDIQRLELQVSYMETNPSFGIIGTGFKIINDSKSQNRFKDPSKTVIYPTENNLIKFHLIFNNVVLHPATLFRKAIFTNNVLYEEEFLHVEEYRLWTQYITKTKFANLPDVLFSYRIHEDQISIQNQLIQSENAFKVQFEYLVHLGFKLDYDQAKNIITFLQLDNYSNEVQINTIFNFIKQAKCIFNDKIINGLLDKKKVKLIIELNQIKIKDFLSMILLDRIFWKLSFKQKLSLLFKILK